MKNYAAETIGSVMSTSVPTVRPDATLKEILHLIMTRGWESIHMVYVVDGNQKLLGQIDLEQPVGADVTEIAKHLMQPVRKCLHPETDQEAAVFMAVKDDVLTIPVIDRGGHLLGSITGRTIIDIMHEEHIEDALLTSGIRKSKTGGQIAKLATEHTGLVVRSRAPWLLVGLVAGLGLGLISSFFEESLKHSIALAYFIPVVAYIADSVGTQSEAIAIRALATLKLDYRKYFFKEVLVGLVLGVGLGILGGLGAVVISGSATIGLVVGLSLFVASTVAAALATLIPFIFKALGKDPALGSGPLATALQDLISVLIYFLFAIALIH